MVLLCRTKPFCLRHCPPNHDSGQLRSLRHFYLLPLHAAQTVTQRIWLPRYRPSSKRRVRLGGRKLRQSTCRHAELALHLCILRREYLPVPLWGLSPDPARRTSQAIFHANPVPRCGYLLPAFGADRYCGHGEPLLAGRDRRHVYDHFELLWQ